MTDAGYKVAATARNSKMLENVNALMKVPLDVTSDKSVIKAIDSVIKTFGRLDILVNNAGYAVRGAIEELTDEAMKSMYDVNVFGLVRLMRAVAPLMRKQGRGSIINISSIVGRLSMPVNGGYSSTKFAVEALSDAARHELRPYGVDVILIEPGSISSHFHETAESVSEKILQNPESPYRNLYKRMEDFTVAQRSRDPEVVSRTVLKALTARKPKPRYLAGAPAGVKLLFYINGRLRDKIFDIALKNTKS